MLKEGIVLGERYEIISRIGAGGMADVYKAQDHKLNRLIAVKVMKAEFREDTSFVTKFQKEAQAAAKLSHPNVVNVYDVGEDRGLYYIVMELVEGITLKNYIARKGKLSVKEATSIAIQVSLGLEAAHNVGIIHRDVKPQNIIISTDGKVKLSDFGIAKAINSNTITANVMGSVHYSSPEQVRGGFSDAKSDIYSLGITMYEMVTGRVPFDGDTTVAIAIKHLQEEIVPPSIYTPDLPYSLEQIILKCTQKDPERRYANVGDMIDDLKQSLINPQGSFVAIAPLTNQSTTEITEAEVKELRNTPAGGRRQAREQAEQQRIREENRLRRERERLKYEEDDDDDDDDDDGSASGLEKAVTIGGFILGAVIILILILVIGNMAGLFHFGRNAEQAQTGAVTPTPTEAAAEPTNTNTAQVAVPNLAGMTVEAATAEANKLGIGVRSVGTEASEQYEKGLIVSQNPAKDVMVDQGTTIEVTTSSGKPSVTIPDVVGWSLDEARAELEGMGLQTKEEQDYSESVAIGNVIRIEPNVGSAVAEGDIVTVFVSKGTDTSSYVEVPNLLGYTEADAISVLVNTGLAYSVEVGENYDYGDGEVFGQSLEPGDTVPPATIVTLYVNPAAAPTPTEEPTPAPEPQYSGEGDYVCYSPLSQPDGYNGGYVRLVLKQGDLETVLYDGPDPWADGIYEGPIESMSGSVGEIEVYENDILIARYPNVTFEEK